MKTKVTIDAGLINLKQKDDTLNTLEKLHEVGRINMVGAERLYEEMRQYRPDAYKKVENYENLGEPFVIGHSRIGRAYIASSNSPNIGFDQLAEIVFPYIKVENLNENQINDIMHLMAHAHSDSEYFITKNSNDFIDGKRNNKNRSDNMENLTRKKLSQLAIKVITPEEALLLFDI
jgi:hypothetical protein